MAESVGGTKLAELDPVCGMTVNPASAKGHAEHAGKTYYFCSKHCAHKFEKDPGQYLNKARIGTDPEFVQLAQLVLLLLQLLLAEQAAERTADRAENALALAELAGRFKSGLLKFLFELVFVHVAHAVPPSAR